MAPVPMVDAHSMLVFLLQVSSLLLVAFLLGRLAALAGWPPIVGELSAGVIAGPSLLGWALPGVSHWLIPSDPAQTHLLDAVGQVGVILLVGVTGLQLDLGLVRRRGAAAARISVAGIVLPLGLGIAVGLLLPASVLGTHTERSTFVLFLGVAMGVSALPVLAKTLLDMRLLHRNLGQLMLSAVTVDDIVGWLLLSVVSAMAMHGVHARDVIRSIAYLIGVVVLAVVAVRPVRAVLSRAARTPGDGPLITVTTVFVVACSAGTQALGMEAVFGAFVAGVVVNRAGVFTAERQGALRTMVLWVLAPLFFATAGLRMDLTGLADPTVLLTGVAVLATALVGKLVGAYAGGRFSRLGHWESFAVGVGMNARGVIEVVVATVGLRLGVLTSGMYTVIMLVAIVTSLMAPPLLRFSMARVEHTAEERLREEMYALP